MYKLGVTMIFVEAVRAGAAGIATTVRTLTTASRIIGAMKVNKAMEINTIAWNSQNIATS